MSYPTIPGDKGRTLVPVKHGNGHFVAGHLHEEDIAPTSKHTYRAGLKTYLKLGYSLPASQADVIGFIEWLTAHRTRSTLDVYISALVHYHEHHYATVVNPCSTPLVKRTLKGARNRMTAKPKQVRPLGYKVLTKAIYRSCQESENSTLGVRDYTMMTLMYVLALRRSELAALTLDCIEFTDHGMVVNLAPSKADRDWDKATVPSAQSLTDATGEAHSESHCPVALVRNWITLLPDPVKGSPLFRSIHKSGAVKEKGIQGRQIAEAVKRRCFLAGIPDWENYAGHSPRRGYGTDTANLQDELNLFDAMRGGRWRSMTSFERYVTSAPGKAATVLTGHLTDKN